MNGTRKQSQSCSGTSTLEAKRGRHHDDGHAASHARDTLVDPAVQRLEAVPIDVVCEYCKFYMLFFYAKCIVVLFCTYCVLCE